ncbi:MAG: hypothetical protein ACOY6K_22400 [Pseudomonadota bacterium]
MDVIPLIMAFAGIIAAVILAIIIGVRARWVHETYGADFGFADRVAAVMTPELWAWSAVAFVLIGVGMAGGVS